MVVEIKIPKMVNKVELKIDVAKQETDPPKTTHFVTKTNNNNNHGNEVKPPQIDFDDLLIHAGEFGRYQILLVLATMPFYIFGVFVYFSQLFITEVSSQHWCWIPELANLTVTERRRLAIPLDENGRYGYSQCYTYKANWTDLLQTGIQPDSGWKTMPCQKGWEFDMSEIPYPTISSEMGWVCDKRSYQATAQSIFFFGSVFGGVFIGWLSDKYGRLPALIVSNLIGCIGGTISIFARNFTEFSICRFFMGMSYDSSLMMSYLLVLEYIAPRYRTMISNVSFALFYSLGAVALPWIALACGHWKSISLATSLPLALAVLAPIILLESPRWLLTRGRVDDAISKILTIGRINKKKIPSKLIQQFKEEFTNKKADQKGNMMDVMKRPLIRNMFFLICLEFMCCVIVFDALVRSLGQLDFDFFVSFSIVSFTEFPSLMIVAFVMDWVGRRLLVTIMSIIACIFCVLTAFVTGGTSSVICAVIARFAINMSYSAAFQWGAELFPTSIRGSALSVIHISGYVATMISAYIVYLETYITWLPLVIAGAVSGISAITALLLPETAKKDMPQTFEDAENLVRNKRFFEMPCSNKKNKDVCAEDNFSFEP